MLYVSEFHSFYGLIFHCMHILYIHLSVDGDLGCFYLLAIVNHVAMNIGVPVSVFNPFGYLPRSEITGSHGNSM